MFCITKIKAAVMDLRQQENQNLIVKLNSILLLFFITGDEAGIEREECEQLGILITRKPVLLG